MLSASSISSTGRGCLFFAAVCFALAGLEWRGHRAARLYLAEVSRSVIADAGAEDPKAKVTALRDFVRASVSFKGVPQEGRPFLRDEADVTLKSGRGWCGEASRAFICLAKEAGIKAQRINLTGKEKHTVAEAEFPSGERVIVDSQNPPTIAELESLDAVMQRGLYSDYYSLNVERLRLDGFISRVRFQPGFLTYWIENPRLIRVTAWGVVGTAFGVAGAAIAGLRKKHLMQPRRTK